MSASDNLSKVLFHGSSHDFEVGDTVTPQHDTYGDGEVHATNDPKWASTFGDALYEVEPVDKAEKINENEGVEHWVSRSGYKVKRRLY